MGSDPLFTIDVNRGARVVAVTLLVIAAGCGGSREPTAPAAPSEDALFADTARQYLEDLYRRQPTRATDLGIHTYDDRLEDYSRKAVDDEVASPKAFRARITAIHADRLSPSNQLDRLQLTHDIDSRLLTLEVVKPWARDPDSYSSGLASTAYIMIQ